MMLASTASVNIGAPPASFQNDLQQDAAGEVFARLGIAHHHVLVVDHQLPHLGQGDVGGSVGVVQATVGYF